jgi:Holliday junction resolvase RusA-like endonuclease
LGETPLLNGFRSKLRLKRKIKTMTKVTFTTPDLPPTSNHQWRSALAHGRPYTYLTDEAKAWREKTRYEFAKFMRKNGIGFYKSGELVNLTITFTVKRDRDIDGGIKPVLDALQGVLYDNDKQVNTLTIYKVKGEPKLFITVNNPKENA